MFRRSSRSMLVPEPAIDFTVLRGCACGAPHPLSGAFAVTPADPDRCPRCGRAATPPEPTVTVPAVVTGHTPAALAARAAFALGAFLRNLAKRL